MITVEQRWLREEIRYHEAAIERITAAADDAASWRTWYRHPSD
jgi:hypothetical protein